MAEFCDQCSNLLFGKNVKPDIDIEEISNRLSNAMYLPVLCEGCGMRAVGKDKNGKIIVALPEDISDLANNKINWIELEDFKRDHEKKYYYHH